MVVSLSYKWHLRPPVPLCYRDRLYVSESPVHVRGVSVGVDLAEDVAGVVKRLAFFWFTLHAQNEVILCANYASEVALHMGFDFALTRRAHHTIRRVLDPVAGSPPIKGSRPGSIKGSRLGESCSALGQELSRDCGAH